MTNMTATELINKYEIGNHRNFEDSILELRREGVDFIPYESEDKKIRNIIILSNGNNVFCMLVVEFQTARIFIHKTIGGNPEKTYTITARALALKAAQFQREVI